MDRVTVLDDELWPGVPPEVIEEAKRAASESPCWIAKRDDGSFVSLDEPQGGPAMATGNLIYVAEISPPGG